MYPFSGALLPVIIDFDTDYGFICGNYTAFYRIENDMKYIPRIIYGKRDFTRLLFNNPTSDSERSEPIQ